jgi:hypothetical protein
VLWGVKCLTMDLPPVAARRPLIDGLEEGSRCCSEPNGWE